MATGWGRDRDKGMLAEHAVGGGRDVALLEVLVPLGGERAAALLHLELRDAEGEVMPAEIDEHILADSEDVALEHGGDVLAERLRVDRVLDLRAGSARAADP